LAILFLSIFYIYKYGKNGNIKLPFDEIMIGIIEIRRSIPGIILLLLFVPLFSKPSINNIIIVITILGWTNFARHSRVETLSLLGKDYITASKMFNADFFHIAKKHILPNIFPTILVLASMSMASNILIEASLSFLGLGIPSNEVSWGSLLNEARGNLDAWWLLVFPGITLFTIVFIFNKVGKIAND
jgi:peptide/nickel transport system permease protein